MRSWRWQETELQLAKLVLRSVALSSLFLLGVVAQTKRNFVVDLRTEELSQPLERVSVRGSVVPPGLARNSHPYPGLTPWAKLFRRSAARSWCRTLTLLNPK